MILRAARSGAIVGATVVALVLLLVWVVPLSRSYPLALLPLLAAGPAAVRGRPMHPVALLLAGFVAGLAAAVVAVAGLVVAVEVLDARYWTLISPASYPPMPPLPRPSLIPGLAWPHQDILLLLPPLSALLALLDGVLLVGSRAGLAGLLGARVAAVRASIETKLVWVLLGLALLSVALGWVGFGALEDIHFRGHRLQLMLDWSAHAVALGEDIRALGAVAAIDDAAARQAALAARLAPLTATLDHLEHPTAHEGIAQALPSVQQFAAGYQDDVLRVQAGVDALAAAVGSAGSGEARLAAARAAERTALDAQQAFLARLNANMVEFDNHTDLEHHATEIALMALVAMSLLAGLVLGQAAAVSITRPLGAVAAQVERIGRGDFATRLALRNRDEVGDLAARLNAMTVELERLYAAEREGRRAAEAFNTQLEAKNAELESVRRALQEAKVLLEQRVAERTAELDSANARLRQSQKMEAIGRLAGGVAHDFNNLLTVIAGFSELLREDLPPGDPLRFHAEEIVKAAERAGLLTQQLLAFSRRQVLAPRTLSLNDVVTDMERMLRRMIGEDIELVLALQPALSPVHADPGQLQQVILNLVVNARDAMPRGGRLTLRTEEACPDAAGSGSAQRGGSVVLSVQDTGCGMDAETLSHIFEPFFTTKGPGSGTGLGLATVYGVIQQSGGHVEVASEPGQGTTFRVYLPRATEAEAPGAAALPPAAPPSARETILLVEDEDQLRRLTRIVLESRGYTVLEASGPEDALRLHDRHVGALDLLLTDVVMPGMSGRDLAQQISARRTDLSVLYISGYTDDALGRHGVLDDGVVLLHKPFTAQALTAKVREVLDQRQKV